MKVDIHTGQAVYIIAANILLSIVKYHAKNPKSALSASLLREGFAGRL